MKNTNDIILELSEDFCVENIYKVRENDPKYKQAVQELKATIESLTESKKDFVKIDDAVGWVETVACDITYKKAFHDGMRFILNAMSGGEVIQI